MWGTTFLTKLSHNGTWDWKKILDNKWYEHNHITIDSANNVWTTSYRDHQTHIRKHNHLTGDIISSNVLGTLRPQGTSSCNQCIVINTIEIDSNDNFYAAGKYYSSGNFLINVNGTSQDISLHSRLETYNSENG